MMSISDLVVGRPGISWSMRQVPHAAKRRGARSAAWTFGADDPAAVSSCRRATRVILTAWELDAYGALIDDALLVVSELASNVHLHVGRAAAMAALTWADQTLSIWVYDLSPARPPIPSPGPREGGTGWDWRGFGLVIVEGIAAQYGGRVQVVPEPGGRGKSVGVELPARATG